jgi:hypothetical protein
VFFANSFDFIQIKQRNQLSENGLSKKVATFIHVILVRKTKLHLKREILYGDPAFQKVLSDTSGSKTKKTAISGFQGKINKKNELLRI